jgi:hypothetical protein
VPRSSGLKKIREPVVRNAVAGATAYPIYEAAKRRSSSG